MKKSYKQSCIQLEKSYIQLEKILQLGLKILHLTWKSYIQSEKSCI